MVNPLNHCTLGGRIITDPQFQQMNGANGPFLKCTFTIAMDRNNLTSQQRQAAKNGDKSIVTSDFARCSAIGKTAEFIQQWCPKGKAVIIDATFQTYKYNNQQTGQEEYGNCFNVESITFSPNDAKSLAQGGQGQGNMQPQQGGYQQPQQSYQQPQGGYQPQQQNYQQQQGGYQQPQQSYQQPQQTQGNFQMFDESNSPF